MRTQFVECRTRYQAKKACPWAAVISKRVYGYMCYESVTDYAIAKRQR